MEKYEVLEMEVLEFDTEDVISASGDLELSEELIGGN